MDRAVRKMAAEVTEIKTLDKLILADIKLILHRLTSLEKNYELKDIGS